MSAVASGAPRGAAKHGSTGGWFAGALLLSGSLVAMVFIAHRQGTPVSARTATATAPSDDALDSLRDRVASLENESQALHATIAARGLPGEGKGATPRVARSPADGTMSAARPSPHHRGRPNFAAIEQAVKAEPRDKAWAPSAEREIGETLAKSFPDATVRELTCATSACRAVVQNSSADAQRELVATYWASMPAGYAGVLYHRQSDENGTPTTVMQLIRSGYDGVLDTQ
jgi:hypothetical protein